MDEEKNNASELDENEAAVDAQQNEAELAAEDFVTGAESGDTDDASLEEKDGVKYETNDNWEFDAKAPTLEDDLVLESNGYQITIEKEKPSEKPSDAAQSASADMDNQIVISTEPLKFVPLAIFVAAVIAVLVVLGIRYFTVPNGKEGELMNPASVVATIDGEKVSIGMYDYYYSSIVSYYEQYAAYGYFDLDSSKDYSKQYTTNDDGEKVSWQKFFEEEALEEVEQITVYYAAALKEGVTLTSSQQETIDTQIETLKSTASENEVSLDEYIKASFGSYCSEDTIRLMLEQYYISANFKGKYKAEAKVTDDEVDEYYNEHKDDYKNIEFYYLALTYDSTDDETKASSVKKAEELMKKMTDKDAVVAQVPTLYADYIESEAASLMENDDSLSEKEANKEALETYEENVVAEISGLSSPFDDDTNEWLFSDDTPIGSTNYYISEDDGYIYVILKTENASLDDSETYNVRHILISPESESDDDDSDSSTTKEYTDEEWAAAKKEAEKVLKEYKNGDKTEYSFARLAEKYSTDTASTSAGSSDSFGGLYESVALGDMITEFEEWATDDSRKYGDTGIVKSDYGYHIMFFISDCPSYQSSIISEIKTQKLDSMIDDAKIKVHQSAIDKTVEKEQQADEEQTTSSSSSSTTTAASTESTTAASDAE